MVLGQVYLDTGRPLAAAMCFSRLSDSEQAIRRYDPELSLLLASSWHMSGMSEKAEEVLKELKQRRPSANFTIRGERVALRVDRFEGQQEFYVKPVPELLTPVRILSGLTVLDDGSPVFLLDLNHLGVS